MSDDTSKGTNSLRDALDAQIALPVEPPFPLFVPNSGLYTASSILTAPGPSVPLGPLGGGIVAEGVAASSETATVNLDQAAINALFTSEELRLDIDSNYPQMKASGRITAIATLPAQWIANVTATAANTYEGSVWYKDGNMSLMPFTAVKIVVTRGILGPKTATVTFSGGGVRTRAFQYNSRYFHPVNFEFDFATNITPVLSFDTGSHPNRPATLPIENLTIVNVYRRAGFDVSVSGAGDEVNVAEAGADARWSDLEMHDAMQAHWSKFANAPQWALWVLFASLHEDGPSLGGIMFDDVGPNQRQGTSLFLDSFIKVPPAGDPAPAAWVNRMIFWTACHEMGHTFNLAHAWQKAAGTPWIALTNDAEARTFMNYPYNVNGGTPKFFEDFQFRFSDQELLFMRHAPFRFVEQGNVAWFDHHGFEQMRTLPEPSFNLELSCPREASHFEFLEPIVLDMTLTNASGQPQVVGEKVLSNMENLTVIIKKRGKPARQLLSYARKCMKENKVAVQPGASLKDSLFVSAGRNGWDVSEPGYYTVHVALHLENEDIVSKPVTIRVAPAKGYEEEWIAQDYFSDGVGRVLAFDGSKYLNSANNTLHELNDRLSESRAAIHARVALAGPLAMNYKEVKYRDGMRALAVSPQSASEARKLVGVLLEKPEEAAGTLGDIDYRYYLDRFKHLLARSAAGDR